MSEELEEVRVLRVQPGDTIVCTVDSAMRQKEFDEVAAKLKDRFPDNEVLVLGGAPIELSVVRPAGPADGVIHHVDPGSVLSTPLPSWLDKTDCSSRSV